MEIKLAIIGIFLWEVLDALIPNGALIYIVLLLILFIIQHKKITIPKELRFFILLFISFIICYFMGTADIASFFKQFIGIFISLIYYYNLVYYYGIDKNILEYSRIAFIFSCFGLLQELMGILGNHTLTKLYWLIPTMKSETVLNTFTRCVGLSSEPFAFAMLLLPAFYLSILSFKEPKNAIYNHIQAIVVILAYIFTFSSIGYIGGFVAIVLFALKNTSKHSKKYKNIIIGILLVAFLGIFFYTYIPEFKIRIDETIAAYRNISILDKTNLSSYALISNMKVSFAMFKNTNFLGVGFGSYGANYKDFSYMLNKTNWRYGINQDDANSMIFRMIGEIGILTFFIIYYIIKIRKNCNAKNVNYCNAMLSLILLKFMRSGNYIFGGTMFFLSIYILCTKENKNKELK